MNDSEILEIFKKTNALLSGHFLLTSGLHSEQYFQCAKVLQLPEIAELLCSQIGKHFIEQKVGVVIAPAIGGIVVAHEVARSLNVRALFAERENGKMALRRGFQIKQNERVLLVEDVITTGGSVKELLNLVETIGCDPVGIGCIVDRSVNPMGFDVELFSLMKLNIEAMSPEKCALCKQNIPLVKPGSRKIAVDG